MQRKRAGIVIFNDVEVLDFCGPFEVLSVARLDEARRRDQPSPFEAVLVAQDAAAVTTSGGMQVLTHATFDDCPPLEILVVPGGWGTRAEMKNERMLAFVNSARGRGRDPDIGMHRVADPGNAGLLDGLRATTHWRSLGLTQELFPRVTVDDASAGGRGRQGTHLGGHLRRHRHGACGWWRAIAVERLARATAGHME